MARNSPFNWASVFLAQPWSQRQLPSPSLLQVSSCESRWPCRCAHSSYQTSWYTHGSVLYKRSSAQAPSRDPTMHIQSLRTQSDAATWSDAGIMAFNYYSFVPFWHTWKLQCLEYKIFGFRSSYPFCVPSRSEDFPISLTQVSQMAPKLQHFSDNALKIVNWIVSLIIISSLSDSSSALAFLWSFSKSVPLELPLAWKIWCYSYQSVLKPSDLQHSLL